MKKCDNGKVDRVHGEHLKVYVISEQIDNSLAQKASLDQKASYDSVKKNSTTHEDISKDFSGEEDTLKEQLFSSSLLRLWRSGACTQRYEANEDDEDFDASCKFAFQSCIMFYYFTGNSAEFTRRRIGTKQGSSCIFMD